MAETVGDRIKRAVELAHITQDKLAKHTGIPPRTLTDYISGRKLPPDRARAISRATDVSLEWLLTGEGDPRPAHDRRHDMHTAEVWHGLADASAPYGTSDIDVDLLERLLLVVETVLAKKKYSMRVDRKAHLVAQLYSKRIRRAAQSVTEEEIGAEVDRFLRLIA